MERTNRFKNETITVRTETTSENIKRLFDTFDPIRYEDVYIEITIPKRKHRKRRIQKKWIKKYGFKRKIIKMPNIQWEIRLGRAKIVRKEKNDGKNNNFT